MGRDQKIRISISADALAKLWILADRRKMTGPMVASRIVEEICAQDNVEGIMNAWRNRAGKERRAQSKPYSPFAQKDAQT